VVRGLYTKDTSLDVLQPLILFIVSRITNKHNLLFGVFAAFFGFFYLKSINLLYDRYIVSPNKNALLHLLFFALINPIFFINGFRFYTAAWIFFYGAYFVILYRDKKYLILAMCSVLVHFSFLGAGAVLLIYFLLGNRNLFYVILLILSFILPELISEYLTKILPGLGAGLQNRVQAYVDENYIQAVAKRAGQTRWFIQLLQPLVMYYLYFGILFLKYKFKNISDSKELTNLFSFLLLFLSFVNFSKQIPSVGRFQTVFILFGVLYIFIMLTQIQPRKGLILMIIGLFPMLLTAAYSLRIGTDTFNALLLAPMPFPFLNGGLSFYELFLK